MRKASTSTSGNPGSPASNSPSTPIPKYKFVFLGDLSVGKTNVITRFMYDTFENSYQATIGIDFVSKTLHLDDRTVRLQLWDTAGQERFKSLIPSYIRDSSVAVVVYDISNRQSFTNARMWIDTVRAERGLDVVIFLVGNKVDLQDKRQVTAAEGEQMATELGVVHIETSAKTGTNIKALFRRAAMSVSGSDGPATSPKPDVIELGTTAKSVDTATPEGSCGC